MRSGRPPDRTKTTTAAKHAEQLLGKYMNHIEPSVQAGHMAPMKPLERISLELLLTWLCDRYDVRAKVIVRKLPEVGK